MTPAPRQYVTSDRGDCCADSHLEGQDQTYRDDGDTFELTLRCAVCGASWVDVYRLDYSAVDPETLTEEARP